LTRPDIKLQPRQEHSMISPQRECLKQPEALAHNRCLREPVQVAPDYSDAMFNCSNEKTQCAEAADYWRRHLAIDSQSEWATRTRRSLKFCGDAAASDRLTANRSYSRAKKPYWALPGVGGR
jgi:hypothetical protein